ncbi:MAG TPA: pentapeptide repeat-containing protein [Candidatus Limnocylindrales bacterium]|nr:pentapeptide repeat-containing protein [Candidatus Limnocylindrales bacterium]
MKRHTLNPHALPASAALFRIVIAFAIVLASNAIAAAQHQCGDVVAPDGLQASDALAVLKKAVGTDVILTCTNEMTYDLRGTDFSEILDSDRSDYIDLSNADLTGADFHGLGTELAHFNGAILRNADLKNSTWGSANFNGADFRGADLRGAKFTGRSNLMAADFRNADLRQVTFDHAILLGAKFDGALLNNVLWDSTVICPDGSQGPCHPLP